MSNAWIAGRISGGNIKYSLHEVAPMFPLFTRVSKCNRLLLPKAEIEGIVAFHINP